MEALKEDFSELEIGSSAQSFQKFLNSQRELFHSQIDQLQKIVVTQCQLTGVNPLSQEMAAGALSINIGKRPRDLLNPKAVKYMQSVFAIKDAISKKESREISALYGVTVTQVREFFTSQRSRVRKVVRLSREKTIRSNEYTEPHDGISATSGALMPIDPVPLNTVVPTSVEEAPSCSTQDDALPGIDDLDKQFVENIFTLMRKEETFSGQVKLMEWILRIQNSTVLCWFLNKGGVMILATWLSQAATEEQTTVLFVILKVLCHLPLHKAVPVHMSAVLQSVNRLRFYRTSDISNRARVLLARLSKLLARSQALKKPNGMKSSSDAQQELMLKQSIDDVVGYEPWQSNIDFTGNILASPYDSSENFSINFLFRKSEPMQTLKLLPASSDDSNKKQVLGITQRRKVQMVEQPGQKTAGRSTQAARAAPISQGRPMSADDIQKAKMRAQWMQSKYGKAGSSNSNKEAKIQSSNKSSTSQASILPLASKVPVRPNIEEQKKPVSLLSKVPNILEASLDQKMIADSKEPWWEKCRRVQKLWQTPPEIKLNHQWSVGAGENSKEVEVQKNRNNREKETIYQRIQEIPSNPKEPWDLEMDYDDTLTPEIPTQQLPDADNTETQATNQAINNVGTQGAPSQRVNNYASLQSITTSQTGSTSIAEPDLELLAVLLKNPELVFALTSGQASNLSSEETVKLLDMIKAGGSGLTSNMNGLDRQGEDNIGVSLPSPTPSSNPGTTGWRQEAVRNPFSQQTVLPNRATYISSEVATANSVPPPHISAAHISSLRQSASIPPYSHQTPASDVVMKNSPLTVTPFHNLHSASLPSMRVESTSSVKPSLISNAEERQRFPIPSNTLLPTTARPQIHPQQQQLLSGPSDPYTPVYSKQIGKPNPASESWRTTQGLPSFYRPLNQNNYNASLVGPEQPQLMSGPKWEGNEYVEEDDFESWSPDNSPVRNPEYMMGRSFPDARTNPGREYRPERMRQRNSSGYRDQNRYGNRRWRDRRR
ncbi:homeobox protein LUMINIDEPENDENS isoform X2 [Ziziphus jujuba]|uniref:Homeobox protein LUMINIDEPENDENS isoform X2 n=1 Tax=Ziziphus jujuba TaxID=326968 RepID=A0ABM3ZSF5_ZIZJJ|nr:homeobox protein LUMINIDEPENDENS isoform X2 [Ziziphus jujuba]